MDAAVDMDNDTVCTISFEPGNKVIYKDDYSREAKGSIDTAGLSWLTVEVLSGWVRDHGEIISREELELLGRHLYYLLFAGKVGEKLNESLRDFRLSTAGTAQYQKRFRVELRFSTEALQLANLPWEFLYIPEERPGGFFLAGERNDLVLTRMAPLNKTMPPLQSAERPLRVMVASCRHREEASSDVQMVKERILAMGADDQIVVTEAEDPTFDELRYQIEKVDLPHILHLICHGEPGGLIMKRAFKSEAERAAHLVDDDLADEVLIESGTVRSLFEIHRPHMVFLHACDGDSPSLTSIFSTAREVAYAAVPAVVAMQYQISVEDALEFVTTFYNKVGEGHPVGEAVKEGRRQLAQNDKATVRRRDWSTRLFGTPVVYVQRDKPLVTARQVPAATGRIPGTDSEMTKCPRCGKIMTRQTARCRECGLQFRCECGAWYEDPETDRFCGDCPRPVIQVPYSRQDRRIGRLGGVTA